MDSNSDEICSEVQDDLSVLPDDALLLIFWELSLKDILHVNFVSKRFYGVVHKNYHRLRRREVHSISTKYNESCDNYPFHLEMTIRSVEDRDSHAIRHDDKKAKSIKSFDERTGFLKMFDIRNLDNFIVPVADNLDIFAILNRSFQAGTKIGEMVILELPENFSGGSEHSLRNFLRSRSFLSNIYVLLQQD
uniref:F-box domain-containing protein n=1 Tax=Strongyloides papillosus TaxID=174720 RepID=A0A0N5CGU1_STREA